MHKLWVVVRQEYLLKVRTKAFLLGTFLMPLLMGVLMVLPGLFMSMKVGKPAELRVMDATGVLLGPLAKALDDTTKTGERLYRLVAEAPAGRDSVQLVHDLGALVSKAKIGGFFLIPANALDGGKVCFYAENVSDFRKNDTFSSGLMDAVREIRIARSQLQPDQVAAILKHVPLETFKVGQGGETRKDTGATFVVAYVIGFIFYFSLLIYGSAMLRAALEEKTSRSAEVMVATVRASTLMTGKIVGIGLVGLTQIAIWAAVVGFLSAGARSGGFLPGESAEIFSQIGITLPMLLAFVVYFLLGFLLYAAFFGAIGAMVNSETEAQQLQWPVTMPIILAFMLMFLAIRDPNATVVRVLSLFPLFTPILMTVRICIVPPAPWEIALSLLLLVGSIWGALWVAGRIFRVGLLMYGKRPNIPELLKWIRFA